MRRFPTLRHALTGLALCVPTVLQADEPPMAPASAPATAPRMKLRRGLHAHATPKPGDTIPGPHLCQACAAKMMQQNGGKVVVSSTVMSDTTMAPMVVANASCPTCGTTPAMMAPTIATSAPGYATVGEPMNQAPVMASAGAPGHAEIGGGMMPGSEPAPVGVMRTSYGAPAPAASLAGQGPLASMNNIPYARPDEMPPSLFMPPTPRRHRILSYILGIPTARQLTAERDARQKSAHAAISYNSASSMPSELPASMVYGGDGK